MNYKAVSLVLVPAALLTVSFYSPASSAVAPAAPACPTLIQGDMDGDGDLDIADRIQFLNAWSSNDISADWNFDGVVNIADPIRYMNHLAGNDIVSKRTILDFNLDNKVDFHDLFDYYDAYTAGLSYANVSMRYDDQGYNPKDPLDAHDLDLFSQWYVNCQ